MIGITVPMQDRHYLYFACFDFECYFDTVNLPKNGPKLTFKARHVALSFAISSNVRGFEAGVCHVTDGDETALISKMVSCLEDISDTAYAIQANKFDYVFKAFNTNHNCRCKNLQKEFEQYLHEIPVLGFNSASYDLQLIKKSLIPVLVHKIGFVIKKAKAYLCLKTDKLRFLDIRNFLAPGFSHKKFLEAFGCESGKFFFPYEFVDFVEKLNYPQVPQYEAFYSKLTRSNITEAQYALVVQTWKEKNWNCLRDLLIYYNLLDVNPFVEAVKKLLEPYIKEGFDIFKTSFSVSGVAKLKMLKEISKDTFFCLFPKRHADLYQKLRSQLTGGLSLIFTRLAVAGETYIKPNRYENPCKVAKIVGYDANSLYLHAIKAPNPTGYFCRHKEDNYRPDPCCRYGLLCF